MKEDLASANVNRTYSLAATNIAIFSFMLFFLYPRFEKGTIDPFLFQATLAAMGIATFSLVFATFYYYRCSLGSWTDEAEPARHARRADRLWLIGCTTMFLAPGLVLILIGFRAVASIWLSLWLVYVLFAIRFFPKVQTKEQG